MPLKLLRSLRPDLLWRDSLPNLESVLIDHEGLKHHAYMDSLGVCTIGIGRNLSISGPGLSTEECLYLLRNDVARVTQELQPYHWFQFQDTVRREVLIELCFNMGLQHLLGFHNFLAAMDRKDYSVASDELQKSLWAKQVGYNRVHDICNRLILGKY